MSAVEDLEIVDGFCLVEHWWRDFNLTQLMFAPKKPLLADVQLVLWISPLEDLQYEFHIAFPNYYYDIDLLYGFGTAIFLEWSLIFKTGL